MTARTQQLQVRENVVGFEKALGEVRVIIQYRSQSLLNLARDYFSFQNFPKVQQESNERVNTTNQSNAWDAPLGEK